MEFIGLLFTLSIGIILVAIINRMIVDEFKDIQKLLFALFMFVLLALFFYETNVSNCIPIGT